MQSNWIQYLEIYLDIRVSPNHWVQKYQISAFMPKTLWNQYSTKPRQNKPHRATNKIRIGIFSIGIVIVLEGIVINRMKSDELIFRSWFGSVFYELLQWYLLSTFWFLLFFLYRMSYAMLVFNNSSSYQGYACWDLSLQENPQSSNQLSDSISFLEEM